MLTPNGKQNLINTIIRYFGIKMTEEWIDEHEKELAMYFPTEDDGLYMVNFSGSHLGKWWTFENECENNTITSSRPRTYLGDALAKILTGSNYWPNDDPITRISQGRKPVIQFYRKLIEKCLDDDRLSLI